MIPEWLPLNWLTFAIATIGLIYSYLTWNHDFWKRKGIPHLKPNIFFGNYTDIFRARTTVGQLMETLYKLYEGKPFVGFWRFRTPGLLIRDPDVTKAILLQEFNSFHQNGFRVHPELDPLVYKNPFMLSGEEWKTTRQLLTPSFTNSKLKPLLPLMEEVAAELVQYLRTPGQSCGPDGLEAKDLCSKYTMEIVATTAFGIKGHSFQNPKAELREMTMQLLQPGLKKSIELMLINFLPTLADLLKLRMMPVKVDQYFRGVVRNVVDEREKKNVTRNDYLQNLINMKKKAIENGEETLRLHPVLPAMEKVCTRVIKLRASDGTELHVPKGQLVVLPTLGFHKDPRYFQDPERFDPDRFSPGRKNDIPKHMFLGFGGGPRQCLGMRFALQQTKLAIATMVENFVIKPTPKTPKVVEQDPTFFLACAKGGLWVRFEDRKITP